MIFNKSNVFENVISEMAAMLSWPYVLKLCKVRASYLKNHILTSFTLDFVDKTMVQTYLDAAN